MEAFKGVSTTRMSMEFTGKIIVDVCIVTPIQMVQIIREKSMDLADNFSI